SIIYSIKQSVPESHSSKYPLHSGMRTHVLLSFIFNISKIFKRSAKFSPNTIHTLEHHAYASLKDTLSFSRITRENKPLQTCQIFIYERAKASSINISIVTLLRETVDMKDLINCGYRGEVW
ncbi:MAG: hypothetical protein MJY54_01785, partial [archaeon]|nr:hypothetical protein [archaeon]